MALVPSVAQCYDGHMTRTAIALLLASLVGCAPAVPFSACDPSTACPDGTTCQQVSFQHASCTVLCEPGEVACGDGGRCFLGPYETTSGRDIYLCRLPCDAEQRCPEGLACTLGEWVDGVSLWCL